MSLSDILLQHPENDIYKTIYSYGKIYPTMTKIFTYKTPRKVREAGWEECTSSVSASHRKRSEAEIITSEFDSVRRTKTRLRDLVASNQFDLFCTFTFKDDRSNIEHSRNKMSRWLRHTQERVGKFDYVIVPEHHKKCDQCAQKKQTFCPHDDAIKPIHFHALLKGYKGKLTNSGHARKDGRIVYNINGYKLGHSTATKIDTDPEAIQKVASYVSKYITKDMPKFKNKRRYWCSHDLTRPKKIENPILTDALRALFPEKYENASYTVITAPQKIVLTSAKK